MLRGDARAHSVGGSIQIYLEKPVATDSQFPVDSEQSIEVAIEENEGVLVIGSADSVGSLLESLNHD